MSLLKNLTNKKGGPQPQSKLEKRVSLIPSTELTIWAETTLYSVGKAVAGGGEKTAERYAEAVAGAEALLAICRELETRFNE